MSFSPRMSVTEAAAYTGLAASTLNKKRMDGTGPSFIKLSARRIAYSVADVDKWIDSRRRQSTSDAGGTSVTGK